MLDRVKFSKLMGMTTSPHDNEALTAVRLANAMLIAENLTWREFLDSSAKPDNSFRVPPSQRTKKAKQEDNRHDNDEEIERLFETAFANASGTFLHFLESIHEWWEQKRFLTDKQFEALNKAASGR